MTHIILDIKFNKRVDFLINDVIAKTFIRDWCSLNKYTLMKDPEIIVFPPPSEFVKNSCQDDDYCGYTGFGILKESHISIHTYPENRFVALDLYSCNQIDSEKNIKFIKKYFENTIEKIKINVILRPYSM